MYMCDRGHVFREDEIVEHREHVTGPNIPESGYDYIEMCCPICGSDEIVAAVVCDYCDQAVPKFGVDYLRFDNGDIICNECLRDYCQENFIGIGEKNYG